MDLVVLNHPIQGCDMDIWLDGEPLQGEFSAPQIVNDGPEAELEMKTTDPFFRVSNDVGNSHFDTCFAFLG